MKLARKSKNYKKRLAGRLRVQGLSEEQIKSQVWSKLEAH